MPPYNQASFAPSCFIYFQLIEVFKIAEDFVWSNGHDKYISTNSLPRYLEQWESQAETLSMADRKAAFRRQQDVLMRAILFQECGLSGNWPIVLGERPAMLYKESIPFSIQMSIVILSETLDQATRRLSAYVDPGTSDVGDLNKAQIKYLVENGWCPSEISIASQGLENTTAYLASRLYRKRTMANHSRCCATKCKAYEILVESYETHHTMIARNVSRSISILIN